jgi:hypothetical protein
VVVVCVRAWTLIGLGKGLEYESLNHRESKLLRVEIA